jgi:hypothetical protein
VLRATDDNVLRSRHDCVLRTIDLVLRSDLHRRLRTSVHGRLRAELHIVLRPHLYHGVLGRLVSRLLVEPRKRTTIRFAFDVRRLLRASLLGRLRTVVLGWLRSVVFGRLRSSLFDMLKLLDVRRIRPQHLLKLHRQLRPGMQHVRNELCNLLRSGLLILQQLRHATSNTSPRVRL